MKTIPERIYLQIYCDGEAYSEDELPASNEFVYWSEDNIYGDDIEYVLASKYEKLLETLKKVEWVCDPEQRDEDTKFCPWCWGVKPGQWMVDYKAQHLEVDIGHSDDCPRQAVIAEAEDEER
jgi:hypothetical protein